jgi:hypothetical protein
MASAEQCRDRLPTQKLALDAGERLRVERDPDVDRAGEQAFWDRGAEELLSDHGQLGVVLLGCLEQGGQRVEAHHRGIAEPQRHNGVVAGEASVLGGALQRGERKRRLVEQRSARGGELDPSARAHEQRRTEGVLELADLTAQRRLRDVQARGGAAEMEFLSDGQEVAERARLEIKSRTLSIDGSEVLDPCDVRA